MSKKKIFRTIIEGCTKPEFDKVVKCYLKEVEDCEKIVNTDGKDDSGLDIRVLDQFGDKIQYQLTIQKSSFEKKLKEDLVKAQENVVNFKYTNKLFFFYSQFLSNKRLLAYSRDAFKTYKIDLELLDSNHLAEVAEDFIELQKLLYSIAELDQFTLDHELSKDKNLNMLYDLVSLGQPSKMKIRLIEAFVLHKIYNEPKIELEALFQSCINHFKKDFDSTFLNNQINRLKGEKRIEIHEDTANIKTACLTGKEKTRIEKSKFSFVVEEKSLVKAVFRILKPYNLENESSLFVKEMKTLLEANYNLDLQEYSGQNSENEISHLSRDFFSFLEKRFKNKSDLYSIANQLFQICKENDFLQRICATNVFLAKINPAKLTNYLSKKRPVLIDTQISIYALCYYYNKKSSFSHYFFKATRDFLDYCRKKGLKLEIPSQYIWETKDHLREALNLIPFTKLPFFDKLGKSNNVFLNFYLTLHEENFFEGEMSYEDFLADLEFTTGNNSELTERLIYYLNELGITVREFSKRYDLMEAQRLFDIALFEQKKNKTSFALKNDSIVLSYLADNDVDIHPIEPVFITWDSSFFNVRKKLYEKHPLAQRWYMFTPAKFIDHYSTLQFDIGIKVISREIISILEASFMQETHALIDSINIILNPENEIGFKYSKKLAEIRDKQVFSREQELELWENQDNPKVIIDDIIFNLNSYFLSKDAQLAEGYKNIFTKTEYYQDMIDAFVKEIEHYKENHKLSDKIVTFITSLIPKPIEEVSNGDSGGDIVSPNEDLGLLF